VRALLLMSADADASQEGMLRFDTSWRARAGPTKTTLAQGLTSWRMPRSTRRSRSSFAFAPRSFRSIRPLSTHRPRAR